MPFQSQKQRAYFYSKLPELAKKWEKETPDKQLPEYKHSEGGEIQPETLITYLKRKRDKSI